MTKYISIDALPDFQAEALRKFSQEELHDSAKVKNKLYLILSAKSF